MARACDALTLAARELAGLSVQELPEPTVRATSATAAPARLSARRRPLESVANIVRDAHVG